jgi:hypothetical protein
MRPASRPLPSGAKGALFEMARLRKQGVATMKRGDEIPLDRRRPPCKIASEDSSFHHRAKVFRPHER